MPPPLPPNTSIVMEFGDFSMKKDGWVELTNWQYSVVTLAYWNSLLNNNCIIPLTAFEKANEQDAVYMDNNKWSWKYNIDTDSLIITTKLEATVIGDSVQWQMYISTSKNKIASEYFLWLEGKSAFDQSGGWWLLNESPSEPHPFLMINWKDDDKSIIKYTYLNNNDPENGGFIIFNKTNDPLFNSSYTVYNKQINNYFYIEWNSDNFEGRIKSPFLFGDISWHCWNSNSENIDCN